MANRRIPQVTVLTRRNSMHIWYGCTMLYLKRQRLVIFRKLSVVITSLKISLIIHAYESHSPFGKSLHSYKSLHARIVRAVLASNPANRIKTSLNNVSTWHGRSLTLQWKTSTNSASLGSSLRLISVVVKSGKAGSKPGYFNILSVTIAKCNGASLHGQRHL